MRTKFIKPTKLDGKQLLAELNAGGVAITELPNVDSEGNFWLDIDAKDEAKAITIIAAHVAVIDTNTAKAKAALLAKLGITADEAALLLA